MDVWESLAMHLSNAWPGLDNADRDQAIKLLREDICRMGSRSVSQSVYPDLLRRADSCLLKILRTKLVESLKHKVFRSLQDNIEAYAQAAFGEYLRDRKKVRKNLLAYLSKIGYILSLKDYRKLKKVSKAVQEIARSNEESEDTLEAAKQLERLKSRLQLAGLLANNRRVVELIIKNALMGRKAKAKYIADACGCTPQAVYNLKAVTILRHRVAEFILDHTNEDKDDVDCKNAFKYAFEGESQTEEYLPALRHIAALARAIKSQKRSPDDSETSPTALACYSHMLVCDKCDDLKAWRDSGCVSLASAAAIRVAIKAWVYAAGACEADRKIHNAKCALWYLKALCAGSEPEKSMPPTDALLILKQPPAFEEPLRKLSRCWKLKHKAALGGNAVKNQRSETESASP